MGVLKYRAADGSYLPVYPGIGGGGGGVDGTIVAGSGLTGGGPVSGNPAVHVGAGAHVRVDADAVRLHPAALTITNWDSITETGFYQGNNAANQPSPVATGWWRGIAVAYTSAWLTVLAWPFGINGIEPSTILLRHKINGVWTPWGRLNNYLNSWDTLDNFLFMRHGGSSSNAAAAAGATRWAIGNKKGASSPNASSDDQFRIQRYDTAGNYAGNAMTISTAGVVNFPGGHALLKAAAEQGDAADPVPADTAATVGTVAAMLSAALDNLGLSPEPGETRLLRAAKAPAEHLFGFPIGDSTPDHDAEPSEEA